MKKCFWKDIMQFYISFCPKRQNCSGQLKLVNYSDLQLITSDHTSGLQIITSDHTSGLQIITSDHTSGSNKQHFCESYCGELKMTSVYIYIYIYTNATLDCIYIYSTHQ